MQCSVEIGFRNIKIRIATTRFFYLCIGFFLPCWKKSDEDWRTWKKKREHWANKRRIRAIEKKYTCTHSHSNTCFSLVVFCLKSSTIIYPSFGLCYGVTWRRSRKKNPSIVGRRCVKTFEVWKWSEKNIKQGCMHCAHMNRSTINPPNHRKFYLCQK